MEKSNTMYSQLKQSHMDNFNHLLKILSLELIRINHISLTSTSGLVLLVFVWDSWQYRWQRKNNN